jgi:transcriptional regulator with XRE-family HTH domain
MDMKVNAQKVKSLRKQSLWSQEELALACGVSRRTVQRAEGDGQASFETTKALAAVFQIDSDQLLKANPHSQEYINVQLGHTIIAVILVVVLTATWSLTRGYFAAVEFLVLMAMLTILICIFSSLTTRVENGFIKWNFGVGLISKTMPISRVVSNRAVRNKAWWGLGIRVIPRGWLYNVSGLKSVELILDDGKRIRIGSDEPEEFNQAIDHARDSLVRPKQ